MSLIQYEEDAEETPIFNADDLLNKVRWFIDAGEYYLKSAQKFKDARFALRNDPAIIEALDILKAKKFDEDVIKKVLRMLWFGKAFELNNDIGDEIRGVYDDIEELLQRCNSFDFNDEEQDISKAHGVINRYIEECLILNSDRKTKIFDLFQHYRNWCFGQKLENHNFNKFAKALRDAGIEGIHRTNSVGLNEVNVIVKCEHEKIPHEHADVKTYFNERIHRDDGSSVTALAIYDNYCDWCESSRRDSVGLPIFSRQLTDLGVQKVKIAGKIRYIGIRMKEED